MDAGLLKIDVFSYLKGDGFQKADKYIDSSKSKVGMLRSAFSSSFAGIVAGSLTVAGAIQQINKSMDLASEKNAQITKLTATMRGMGISDDRTASVIKYAEAMADVGTVGRAVTLSATQQMATYNLTDESLKKLIPSMQDIIVQSKGLNATTGDGVNVANMFGKAILGQAGELQQAGVSLTKHQEQLIRTGTQEQKVSALIDAVRMNVGEQNKEFAKTPEGKIRMVQNRIMSLYEDLGNKFLQSKNDYYSFINDNFDVIRKYVSGAVDFLLDLKDVATAIFQTVSGVWSGLSSEIKGVLIAIGIAISATFAPITTIVLGVALVVQDLWVAFKGGDSVIGSVFDSMSEFLGLGVTFDEFREDVKNLWKAFTDSGMSEFLMKALVFPLQYGINLIKVFASGVVNLTKMLGGIGSVITSIFTGEKIDFSAITDPMEKFGKDFIKNFDFTQSFDQGYNKKTETPGNEGSKTDIKGDASKFSTSNKTTKIEINQGDIKIDAKGLDAKEVSELIDKKRKENDRRMINEIQAIGGV